jgi:hypothetical protein
MSLRSKWTAFALGAIGILAAGCNYIPTASTTPQAARVPTYYRVSGQNLYDACGERVVVKGIEQFFANPSVFPTGRVIPHIGYTGANTVRILPYMGLPGEPHQPGWRAMSAAQVEHLIQLGLSNHMLVDVALAGGFSADIYLRPDIKAMLMKYQSRIVIHAAGEGYQSTGAQWAAHAKAVIAKLRGAGYKAPLYILANNGGRNLRTILSYGASVLASDPLRNVVFGWQAYWSGSFDNRTDFYQKLSNLSLRQAFGAIKQVPFMIQVGLSGDQADMWPKRVDILSSLLTVHALGLNWMWWDWAYGPGQLTVPQNYYGSWDRSKFNAAAIVNEIKTTSVRTYFQNTGRCR